MDYSEQCSHCGHLITAYTLPLNNSLVSAFIRFADQYLNNGRRPIKKIDLGLTNSQYTNFHNLIYFGIIEQKEKGEGWHLTRTGERFYYGELGLLSPAGFMAGKMLPDDHTAWNTHKTGRHTIFIYDVVPGHWKRRPDYKMEKIGGSSQVKLF